MEASGDLLVRAIASAERVVLVAPFVKVTALDRLLLARRTSSNVELFTRWLPEDVARGVTDVEVFDFLADGRLQQIHVHPRLHAKLYRFDGSLYVGSANLTLAGLGWKDRANLELLVPTDDGACADFEALLRSESVPATLELRAAVSEAAALIDVPRYREEPIRPLPAALPLAALGPWWPRTRRPETLFEFYQGRGTPSAAGREQLDSDLSALRIPAGLSQPAFTRLVRAKLLQERWCEDVSTFARVPRRFGEMRAFVGERIADRDPVECWQTAARWLLLFFPGDYTMDPRPFSEIFHSRR